MQNNALEKAVVNYRSTFGSVAMKEGRQGDDEILIDLRGVPLYRECSSGALLNPEIYDYVQELSSFFSKHNHFTIHWLFADDISPEEREKVKKIFRAHYANQHRSLARRLQKEALLALLFIFVGFLFLSFHLPFIQANGDSIYGEILDIFGWVLIWEAGSILFANSLDNQSELRWDLLLFNADFDEKAIAVDPPSPAEEKKS